MSKLKLGAPVPDFEIDIYDAVEGDFGKVSLAELKSQGEVDHSLLLPG